jgi:hypothetical protein
VHRRAILSTQFDMITFECGKMGVGHRDSSGGLDVSEHSSYRKGHGAFFTASCPTSSLALESPAKMGTPTSSVTIRRRSPVSDGWLRRKWAQPKP